MSLEALKFLERRKIRIAVVQMHDKSHCHEIVAEMVDERAASGAVIERPAERVLHEARAVFVGRDLPELFEPDAEFLRLAVLAQAETLDQHLGQAFCQSSAVANSALSARPRRVCAARSQRIFQGQRSFRSRTRKGHQKR